MPARNDSRGKTDGFLGGADCGIQTASDYGAWCTDHAVAGDEKIVEDDLDNNDSV